MKSYDDCEGKVVTGIELTGDAWKNGWKVAGWSRVFFEDGTSLFLGGSKGFDQITRILDDRGADTERMKERLDTWVATGKLPPHNKEGAEVPACQA